MQPTVISGLADTTRCMQEEIFGQYQIIFRKKDFVYVLEIIFPDTVQELVTMIA